MTLIETFKQKWAALCEFMRELQISNSAASQPMGKNLKHSWHCLKNCFTPTGHMKPSSFFGAILLLFCCLLVLELSISVGAHHIEKMTKPAYCEDIRQLAQAFAQAETTNEMQQIDEKFERCGFNDESNSRAFADFSLTEKYMLSYVISSIILLGIWPWGCVVAQRLRDAKRSPYQGFIVLFLCEYISKNILLFYNIDICILVLIIEIIYFYYCFKLPTMNPLLEDYRKTNWAT